MLLSNPLFSQVDKEDFSPSVKAIEAVWPWLMPCLISVKVSALLAWFMKSNNFLLKFWKTINKWVLI